MVLNKKYVPDIGARFQDLPLHGLKHDHVNDMVQKLSIAMPQDVVHDIIHVLEAIHFLSITFTKIWSMMQFM